MKFELDCYSVGELTQLIKAAERRLKELAKSRPSPMQNQAPKTRKKRKLGKVAPKYRDPSNPRNTWSGRGSQPRWLSEKVKRGHHLADFLIPGVARPTAKEQISVGQRKLYKANAG